MGIVKKTYYLIIGFYLIVLNGLGQEVNPEQRYNSGKQFFEEQKWGLARQNFEFVYSVENNPYTYYALFYHAMASYKENFTYLARDGFKNKKGET